MPQPQEFQTFRLQAYRRDCMPVTVLLGNASANKETSQKQRIAHHDALLLAGKQRVHR